MIDPKHIGNKIRELRLERGLTQSEFAKQLSVSFQAVSNWERGITPPDLDNMVRIAKLFSVLVDDIICRKNESLYLGIDGGGTKTELVLVNSEGCVLKQLRLEGCNPNDVGVSSSISILIKGINHMLIDFPSVKYVFCGIAGVLAGNFSAQIEKELKKRFPALVVKVKTDSYNLFGIDSDADIALISGTGSVAFIKKEDSFIRLGGWGHLLDRGGSAYDMGRAAIQIAAREEDMQAPRSVLGKAVLDEMGTDTVWSGVKKIYSEGKPYVAGFARAVFSAYERGDKNAISIVDENARALAELLNTATDLYKAKPLAIASGGIFENYGDVLSRHISKYSKVRLTINSLPPVFGACRHALAMAKADPTEEFNKNFEKSYKDVK